MDLPGSKARLPLYDYRSNKMPDLCFGEVVAGHYMITARGHNNPYANPLDLRVESVLDLNGTGGPRYEGVKLSLWVNETGLMVQLNLSKDRILHLAVDKLVFQDYSYRVHCNQKDCTLLIQLFEPSYQELNRRMSFYEEFCQYETIKEYVR